MVMVYGVWYMDVGCGMCVDGMMMMVIQREKKMQEMWCCTDDGVWGGRGAKDGAQLNIPV